MTTTKKLKNYTEYLDGMIRETLSGYEIEASSYAGNIERCPLWYVFDSETGEEFRIIFDIDGNDFKSRQGIHTASLNRDDHFKLEDLVQTLIKDGFDTLWIHNVVAFESVVQS